MATLTPAQDCQICRGCGQDEPLTSFADNRKSRTGRAHLCQACKRFNAACRKVQRRNGVQAVARAPRAIGRLYAALSRVEQRQVALDRRAHERAMRECGQPITPLLAWLADWLALPVADRLPAPGHDAPLTYARYAVYGSPALDCY